MEEVLDVVESEAIAFLIAFVLIGGPCLIVFGLLCRLLWHAGSWFKRRSRSEYHEEDYK